MKRQANRRICFVDSGQLQFDIYFPVIHRLAKDPDVFTSSISIVKRAFAVVVDSEVQDYIFSLHGCDIEVGKRLDVLFCIDDNSSRRPVLAKLSYKYSDL